MAKRRKTRTRTVTRVITRRGGFGAIVNGVIAGAVASIIPDSALWGLGDAIGVTAVGYLTKNKTIQALGGFMLGGKLLSAIGSELFGKKGGTSPSGFL